MLLARTQSHCLEKGQIVGFVILLHPEGGQIKRRGIPVVDLCSQIGLCLKEKGDTHPEMQYLTIYIHNNI